MNSQSNFKDDLLRQYISHEKIEEAPEGFTSKVMSRIGTEAVPAGIKASVWKKHLIPMVSILVTVILIATALLIPESQSETFALPVLKLLKNIKLTIPEIDLFSDFKLTLPSVTIYIFIGIACLTIFDKALSGIFKR